MSHKGARIVEVAKTCGFGKASVKDVLSLALISLTYQQPCAFCH